MLFCNCLCTRTPLKLDLMEEQGVFVLQTPVVCDPVASFNCLVSSGRGDQEFTHLVDVLPVTAHCGFNLERWRRSDLILSRYWTPKDGIDDIFSKMTVEMAIITSLNAIT